MDTSKEEASAVAGASNVVDLFDGLETKVKSEEGVEIEILRADGEPSGLFIKVLGQDSKTYTKIKEKQDRSRTRELSKRGRAALNELFDVNVENEKALIVACCIDWRHTSGNKMPFAIGRDVEQTEELFDQFPIIYDQVRVGINDRANFTKVLAKP